jgi:hypothetical protein
MRVWYVCYIIMLSSAGVLIRRDSPVLLPDMHCCQHAFVLFISHAQRHSVKHIQRLPMQLGSGTTKPAIASVQESHGTLK